MPFDDDVREQGPGPSAGSLSASRGTAGRGNVRGVEHVTLDAADPRHVTAESEPCGDGECEPHPCGSIKCAPSETVELPTNQAEIARSEGAASGCGDLPVGVGQDSADPDTSNRGISDVRQSDDAAQPFHNKPSERPERDAAGRFGPKNRAALKHGAFARNAASVPELADVAAEVEQFRQDVLTEQGGDDCSTIRRAYVDRLAECELLVRLLGRDLADRGIFTRKGRVRSSFNTYLQTVGRWDQTARQIGMDRRPRVIETLEQWRKSAVEE